MLYSIASYVALRRNDDEWRLKLPKDLQDQVLLDSNCGPFFCFVNHQDHILKLGYDPHAFKARVIAYLERRGAHFPAGHNVGSIYHATPDYEAQMRRLDPTNSCNAGVGKTSRMRNWH